MSRRADVVNAFGAALAGVSGVVATYMGLRTSDEVGLTERPYVCYWPEEMRCEPSPNRMERCTLTMQVVVHTADSTQSDKVTGIATIEEAICKALFANNTLGGTATNTTHTYSLADEGDDSTPSSSTGGGGCLNLTFDVLFYRSLDE